jgi:hypothetical protein
MVDIIKDEESKAVDCIKEAWFNGWKRREGGVRNEENGKYTKSRIQKDFSSGGKDRI